MTSRFAEWLYLAFVAILPVMQPFNVRWRGYTLPAADFLFVAVAMAFGMAMLAGTIRLRWIPWCWSLVAFAGAMVASTLASNDVRGSVIHLAGTLYLLSAAFVTITYVTNPESLRRALMAWTVGAAVTAAAALAGLLLFMAGRRDPSSNPMLAPDYGGLPPGPYPRLIALFLNFNMLCTYTVASALIVLAAREARWIGGRLSVILLIGLLFAAVLSLSPGLGGLLLALGLWWTGIRRSQSPRLARCSMIVGIGAAVAALAALTISPASIMAGLASGNVSDVAPSARVMTWQDAWQTFVTHPWFGKGLGLPVAAVSFNEASGPKFFTDAHNTWLSILAQAGLLGGLAFIGVVWPLLRNFRLPSPDDEPLTRVRIALQLAFVGGVLYQTLSGSYEDTRHVWVLMGLVAAAQFMPDEGHWPIAKR